MMPDDQHSYSIVVDYPIENGEGKPLHETSSYLSCNRTVEKRICSDASNCLINLVPKFATKPIPLSFVEVECLI